VCAELFIDKKELWQHLVPPHENDSTELVREFFSSVAALMSAQLRSLVINSLADLLSFIQIHQVCLSVCHAPVLIGPIAGLARCLSDTGS